MMKLLILADDLTGALDTGILFANKGIDTVITTVSEPDPSLITHEVLVIDTETRHLDPHAAAGIVVKTIDHIRKFSSPYIFKKTDSALRGNIGAELEAVVTAARSDQLIFIPALPAMNRTTRNGIQMIDGTPVAESVFGDDPFEPVRESSIPAIIGEQSQLPVHCYSVYAGSNELSGKTTEFLKKGICLFDAETDADIRQAVIMTGISNHIALMAGCSGMAAVLSDVLPLIKHSAVPEVFFDDSMAVICGSLNPISKSQIRYAENHGFSRLRLPSGFLRNRTGYLQTNAGRTLLAELDACLENRFCLIDTYGESTDGNLSFSEDRTQSAEALSWLSEQVYLRFKGSTIMVIGGDTIYSLLNRMEIDRVVPVCELMPGTVLSTPQMGDRTVQLITKSGGFGQEGLIIDLVNQLRTLNKKESLVKND